jgi:hypothetical protein
VGAELDTVHRLGAIRQVLSSSTPSIRLVFPGPPEGCHQRMVVAP